MEPFQNLQVVAILVDNESENFKELRNKKVSLGNSLNIRQHILNQNLICALCEKSLMKYTAFEKLIQ